MSMTIMVHGIDKVAVTKGKDFVTVDFSTPALDTVNLFFPDHAAVEKMIEELLAATKAAQERLDRLKDAELEVE